MNTQQVQAQGRHASLPVHLTVEELQQWIRRASVEKFKDTTKRYFTNEEVQEFEHESSKNGRSINRLMGILAKATGAIKKGTTEELTIVIPATVGTDLFDKFRHQNDDLIEAGYEEVECEVFGIVNTRTAEMEYFALDGQIIPERTRGLSAKEKQQYLTVQHMAPQGAGDGGAKLYIQDEDERNGTEG